MSNLNTHTLDARTPGHAGPGENAEVPQALSHETRLKLLRLMLHGRFNDEAEAALKRRGQGHFLMSSKGHEGLAGMALAMKEEDWFHPHYRDRAIVLGRGVSHEQFFLDYFAKRNSATGGRQMPLHYNSRRHRIVSLSSPVATNILQCVGMAMSLKSRGIPEVVVGSIGDASTREGEVMEGIAEAAVHLLPVVFLIEDNRYGISTPTYGKTFWTIEHSLVTDQDGQEWFLGCRVDRVDGLDPEVFYAAATKALERARGGGGPTCLVARVERMGSHSSSDDQRLYRSKEEIEALAEKDPLACYETRCLAEGVITPDDLATLKSDIQAEVENAIADAKCAADPDPASVIGSAFAPLPEDLPEHEQGLPHLLAKRSGGLTMAQCIDLVLEQEMRRNPRIWVYGEDIEDPKGDVFSTTKGLSTKFPGRVQNSPLAEATIMGTAIGRAILGDLPVPCIQFVDFMGPALNQLLNEVTTFHWRSMGQWNCPIVAMAPYGAYLPGLGPWHSQTNEAVFAHIPGIHVVIPSSPGDAAGLLRFSMRCNRPVLFLYPKALLHGAEETVCEPGVECIVPFGRARIVRPGRDVTVVTWGNCVAICKEAAERAARDHIEVEILDLRTIVPWDRRAVLDSVARTGRLLVVHEDARTCGLGGDVIAEVVAVAHEQLQAAPLRITKTDDHNPYQFGLELSILPSVEAVSSAIGGLYAQCIRPEQVRSRRDEVALGSGFAMVPPVSASKPVATPIETAPPVAAPKLLKGEATRVPIVVPKQSPTDEDAILVRYFVKPGDAVTVGAQLAELEANKGSYEIESTHDGVVAELLSIEGDRVFVDRPVMYLDVAEGSPAVVGGIDAERAGASAFKRIRISPAQLQVGALALKSQHEIPSVSVATEADVTSLVKQRKALQAKLEAQQNIHVTFTHLILWAMVKAMESDRHEGFRGRLDADFESLLVEPHVNVGFAAVGPDQDLYSPVVKGADLLGFVDLVRRTQELTDSVRTGSINTHELQGAQVTLTNIGVFEAIGGVPFVMPGQVAMVCTGTLLSRPRFKGGAGPGAASVEDRTILPMTLVFDHRPFNGSHAASFLQTIKHNMESMELETLI